MRYTYLLLLGLIGLASGCQRRAVNTETMTIIDRFERYITGDFSNAAQVAAERMAGQQLHPLALHINRRADARISGAPEREGFWVLEESYYVQPGRSDTVAKPYLFFFAPLTDTTVALEVYQWPEEVPTAQVHNANPDLRFRYADLRRSPTFAGATYVWRAGAFHTHTVSQLGGGRTFSLIERFTADRLEVMELLEKDGQRLTPYATLILYDRVTGLERPLK